MIEELERLERDILLDFYEKNDNSQIEVLLDYKRVWARYLDRKTFLWEGEAIDDNFNDMKTHIYFRINTNSFEWNGGDISFIVMHHFLEKDFQRLIDINKLNGIDVKITIGAFKFCEQECYFKDKKELYRNLMTTYKLERI
jgi:hypothetical protein